MFAWLVLAAVLGGANADPSSALEEISRAVHRQGPVRITSELFLELLPAGEDASPEVSEPVKATIDWTSPGHGVFRVGDYDAYIQGTEVIITRDGVDDAYVRCSPATLPVEAIRASFESCPFPMLALAFPTSSGQQIEHFLHAGLQGKLSMQAMRDDQGNLNEVKWTGRNSEFVLKIDPVSGRPVTGMLVEEDVAGLPTGSRLRSRWSWAYEEIPQEDAVAFQRGNRFRVDRLTALTVSGDEVVRIPTLRLASLDGKMIDLESLRGRVVVVDFWATWCNPCIKALPKLQQLSEEMAHLPVTILGVDCYEKGSAGEIRKKVEARVKSLSLTFTILLDETGETAKNWGVQGIPATFVIGPDGQIVASHTGAGADYLDKLREEIEAALQP